MPIQTRQMFSPQTEAARYQLELAQALQQRAMVPNMPRDGGPVQAQYGMGNGLVDLANALASSWNVRRANKAYTRAQEADKAQKQQAQQAALMQMIGGQPGSDGVGPPSPTPSYEQTVGMGQQAINAGVAPEIAKALMEARKPKAPERVDLGDRYGLLDESGRVVREIPKGNTPDAVMREQGEQSRWGTPSANTQMSVGATLRGQNIGAETARRGQDMLMATTQRGQDMTADTARRGAGQKAPTEFQVKAHGQLRRMEGAEKVIGEMGYSPTGSGALANQAVSNLPGGNLLRSGDYQSYEQAAREWISGVLRLDSGAAVPEQEFERYFKTYFPQPGDSPGVVEQKKSSRDRAAAALREVLPSGGQVATEFATEADAESAARAGRLQPGTRVVVGGVQGTWQ